MFPASDPDRLRNAEGDAITASPFATLTGYNVSIFYILWYFFVQHWNLANYVSWVRFNGVLLNNRPSPTLYLSAIVISEALYWLVSGPMFFYSAKYRKGRKDGYRWLSLGIVIQFLFADTPLWLLDIATFYFFGFQDVVQSIALILRSLSFLFNALISWHVYLHRMSKLLQQVFGRKSKDLQVIAEREAILRQRRAEGKKIGDGGLSGYS